MSEIKFVSEVPTARRGRPADPAIAETHKALAAKPGAWAQVKTGVPQAEAARFAKGLSRSDGFQATTRQGDGETYNVFARAIAKVAK